MGARWQMDTARRSVREERTEGHRPGRKAPIAGAAARAWSVLECAGVCCVCTCRCSVSFSLLPSFPPSSLHACSHPSSAPSRRIHPSTPFLLSSFCPFQANVPLFKLIPPSTGQRDRANCSDDKHSPKAFVDSSSSGGCRTAWTSTGGEWKGCQAGSSWSNR